MLVITINNPETTTPEILEETAAFLKSLADLQRTKKNLSIEEFVKDVSTSDAPIYKTEQRLINTNVASINDKGEISITTKDTNAYHSQLLKAGTKIKNIQNDLKSQGYEEKIPGHGIYEKPENPEEIFNTSTTVPAPPKDEVPLPPPDLELDAKGLPWDERIHSREKTKTKDGVWRYKKKIPPNDIEKVEAELHALVQIQGHQSFVPKPPADPTIEEIKEEPFTVLMEMVENVIKEGLFSTTEINTVVKTVPNAKNLAHVSNNPQYVSDVHSAIRNAISKKRAEQMS